MFKAFSELEKFFGAPFGKVDIRLRQIVINGYRPDWLRNAPKLKDLPRNSDFKDGTGFHIGDLSPDALTERLVWVIDTLDGEWYLGKKHLYLKIDTDIVYYRLRWAEKVKKTS
jgi:hypothetical protein